MEKMKLVVAGDKVYGIGYRYFLMEAALNHGIERFRAVNVLNHQQGFMYLSPVKKISFRRAAIL